MPQVPCFNTMKKEVTEYFFFHFAEKAITCPYLPSYHLPSKEPHFCRNPRFQATFIGKSPSSSGFRKSIERFDWKFFLPLSRSKPDYPIPHHCIFFDPCEKIPNHFRRPITELMRKEIKYGRERKRKWAVEILDHRLTPNLIHKGLNLNIKYLGLFEALGLQE